MNFSLIAYLTAVSVASTDAFTFVPSTTLPTSNRYSSLPAPIQILTSKSSSDDGFVDAEMKAVAVREAMMRRRFGFFGEDENVNQTNGKDTITELSGSVRDCTFREQMLITRLEMEKKERAISTNDQEQEYSISSDFIDITSDDDKESSDVFIESNLIDENPVIDEVLTEMKEESVKAANRSIEDDPTFSENNEANEDLIEYGGNMLAFEMKQSVLDISNPMAPPSCSDEVFQSISNIDVKSIGGETLKLGAALGVEGKSVMVALSHFGDFNAWEVTQQYITAIEKGYIDEGVKVILVGIGSSTSASFFASSLNLSKYSDRIGLVADENASVTNALGCYKGWLAIDKEHAERYPATDVNPYLKLFGMIFGFGSPGTISRVLQGYIGDQNGDETKRTWVVDSLLSGSKQGRWPQISEEAFEGVPSNSGLRPFELATLRAQTGIHIVKNWSKLRPANQDLFTAYGGTFVFTNGECCYKFFDQGILNYAPISDIYRACK